MSTTDYANQEALNRALNIYRTCMRGFIIHHLKKIPSVNVEDIVIDSVSDWRAVEIDQGLSEAGRDIKSIIDIDDFPVLVNANWEDAFDKHINGDKDFRNQLWLIKTCRDQSWAHPPEGDAESEGTRAYLFLIAEVLRKINKPDKQREVEAIRDDLFFDDFAERLEKAEEDLAEHKKLLAAAEAAKNEYKEKNTELSEQIDAKEKQRKRLDRNLKNAKERNNKLRGDGASVKKRLEESEAAQDNYKKRLETVQKELNETEAEWKKSEERLAAVSNQLAQGQTENEDIMTRLAAMQDLFTIATLEEPEIRSIFPTFDTDSRVRILDRRGRNKKDYLRELLNQKQPSIIYVQSQEKVEELLTSVLPEKADVIGELYETTPAAEEKEILEKLENGALIAVVSNATFSTLVSSHPFEHFVFCHLVPSLDVFCERCQPAFTSTRNAYLHLIYESRQNIERYPKDKTIRALYKELKKLAETNGDFINFENVYDESNIKKLEIETGLVILEELQYLEQEKIGIKLLQSSGKQLKESTTYRRGRKLREEAENSPSFQYEYSIEQIWEGILEKVAGT